MLSINEGIFNSKKLSPMSSIQCFYNKLSKAIDIFEIFYIIITLDIYHTSSSQNYSKCTEAISIVMSILF
jgi:hypothetical protein